MSYYDFLPRDINGNYITPYHYGYYGYNGGTCPHCNCLITMPGPCYCQRFRAIEKPEVKQGWQCPLCFRINAPDVRSCDCRNR